MDSGEHNMNASSVREYAYDEDKNMRFRPQMEDSKWFSFLVLLSSTLHRRQDWR